MQRSIGSEVISFAEGLSKIGPALAGIIAAALIVYGAFLLKKRYDEHEFGKRKKEWEFDKEKRNG